MKTEKAEVSLSLVRDMQLHVLNAMALIGNHHDQQHQRAYKFLQDAYDLAGSALEGK